MVQPQQDESIDPAATVITKMREQGISSLPRNYELVYQFLNTSNAALIREYAALGQRPTQLQLDEVGRKFLPHHHSATAAEETRERISDEIQGIARLFKQDEKKLKRYSNLLGETSSRISGKSTPGLEALDGLCRTLSSATGDTIGESEAVLHQLVERTRELDHLRSELEEYKRLATTDSITSLSNRRAFDERLAEIYSNRQDAREHALMVADIDHFKTFNDTYGHQVGDRVLSAAATMMRKTLGQGIFIARTGGEEFAVVLEDTDIDAASAVAERIRKVVESTPLKNQNGGVDCGHITMSFGLCMADDASSAEELYRKADAVLYEAKKAGRNQLKIHTPRLKKMRALFKR